MRVKDSKPPYSNSLCCARSIGELKDIHNLFLKNKSEELRSASLVSTFLTPSGMKNLEKFLGLKCMI